MAGGPALIPPQGVMVASARTKFPSFPRDRNAKTTRARATRTCTAMMPADPTTSRTIAQDGVKVLYARPMFANASERAEIPPIASMTQRVPWGGGCAKKSKAPIAAMPAREARLDKRYAPSSPTQAGSGTCPAERPSGALPFTVTPVFPANRTSRMRSSAAGTTPRLSEGLPYAPPRASANMTSGRAERARPAEPTPLEKRSGSSTTAKASSPKTTGRRTVYACDPAIMNFPEGVPPTRRMGVELWLTGGWP